MIHIQFIIEVLSVNMGALALLSSILLYINTRDKEYLYRGALISTFLLIVFSFLIFLYMEIARVPYSYKFIDFASLGIVLLVPVIIVYTNRFYNVKNRGNINTASVVFMVLNLISFIIINILNLNRLPSAIISTSGLIVSIIYAGISFIKKEYPYLTKTIKRNRIFIGVLALLFIPFFLFIDIFRGFNIIPFLSSFDHIYSVPLFFLIWSISFLHEDILGIIYKKHKKGISYWSHKVNLTQREEEIVEQLIKGLTYQEVGNNLFISKETVKSHIKNIYTKFSVKSKLELIRKLDSI